MKMTANNPGQKYSPEPLSVFRRTIKLTHQGVHVGIVGDFEDKRKARSEIHLWSCIKRHSNHKNLFKVIFRMEH